MTGLAPDSVSARLVAAAALEIRQIGPKRMTVSGVAARLGMSHANVYRHFPGKAGLIDAVLGEWLKRLDMRLQEITEGPDPADDKLERFFVTLARSYSECCQQDPAIFRLLAEPFPETVEAQRHARRVDQFIERIAEEGIATRLFGGRESRRAAQLARDLAHRFIDPASLLALVPQGQATDARRDRTLRWAVRAITGRN